MAQLCLLFRAGSKIEGLHEPTWTLPPYYTVLATSSSIAGGKQPQQISTAALQRWRRLPLASSTRPVRIFYIFLHLAVRERHSPWVYGLSGYSMAF